MILTCPNCATRFFADDAAIGSFGRRVKCAACGEEWTSSRPEPVEPAPAINPETAADSLPAPSPDSTQATTESETASPLFVERASAPRTARSKGPGRPWALGLVIVVFVVVAGLLVFQPALQRAFPGASTFYHSIGLSGGGQASG